ncbi:HalOD1 output domain-containing protein [Halostagnicola bangensis]
MANGGDTVDTSIRTAMSQAVVEAVANEEGVPPAELCPPEYEPLHAVINPEALDTLFAPRSNGCPRPEGTVTFTYCGYDITIESDRTVHLS